MVNFLLRPTASFELVQNLDKSPPPGFEQSRKNESPIHTVLGRTMAPPKLSLVVATLGRSAEVNRLFLSLQNQTFKFFDVVVVDQNGDDRIENIIKDSVWNFEISYIHRPDVRGLSRARNIGWRSAKGEILVFPDDDCWYPPSFLDHGVELLNLHNVDLLSGRASDEAGRNVNARYSRRAHFIDRSNVWTSQMEWASLIRRQTLESLDGYDEQLGIGAPTPWQAAEGQDLILRALKAGRRCYFDPSLSGRHEEFEISSPDTWKIRKTRAYARGMGFVLRKHNYGLLSITYWVSRSLFNAARHMARGNRGRARFYLAVAVGRIEGWSHSARCELPF
jgi:glycosyltransferase involved in cell wall biosynthesis